MQIQKLIEIYEREGASLESSNQLRERGFVFGAQIAFQDAIKNLCGEPFEAFRKLTQSLTEHGAPQLNQLLRERK